MPRTLKIQITDSSTSAAANSPQFDKYFDVFKVYKGKSELVEWNTIRQEGDQFEISHAVSADLPIELQIRKCNAVLRSKNAKENAPACIEGGLITKMVDRMVIDVTVGEGEEPILESQVLAKNVNPNFVQMSVVRLELQYWLMEGLAQTFENKFILTQAAIRSSLGAS